MVKKDEGIVNLDQKKRGRPKKIIDERVESKIGYSHSNDKITHK
jgi:hypothetical protein